MSNLYRYRCSCCEVEEARVAAFWEGEATCVRCGETMFRLDDPFVVVETMALAEKEEVYAQ